MFSVGVLWSCGALWWSVVVFNGGVLWCLMVECCGVSWWSVVVLWCFML